MRKRLWLVSSLLILAALAVACAGHPEGWKSPRELTDIEKERVVQIALNTPEARRQMEEESVYMTRLMWVAIVWRNSEASEFRYFEFEDVKNDPNYQLVPESAVWYPGVYIRFGEPSQWVIQVAVDLTEGKAIDVMSSTDLSSPGRFPIPSPK